MKLWKIVKNNYETYRKSNLQIKQSFVLQDKTKLMLTIKCIKPRIRCNYLELKDRDENFYAELISFKRSVAPPSGF